MANFQEKLVGEVTQPHPLLLIPGRRIPGIHYDVPIVGLVSRIIYPAIPGGDLVKRMHHTGGGPGCISKQHSDPKQPGWRTLVFLSL